MLSERYINDDKSTVYLGESALSGKQALLAKAAQGIYPTEEAPCSICQSGHFKVLSKKERRGIPLSVVICQNCGLVQANPRLDKEAYVQFYNNEYELLQAEADGENETFFSIERKRGKKIYEFLKGQLGRGIKDKFIVEIGAGAGGILSYFQEQGNEVYGLDLGEEYVRFGQKKGVRLEVGGIEKLKQLKKKPYLVIYNHVLEHLLDPLKELQEVKKHLREGTFLYLAVPGIKNIPYSHQSDFLKYLTITHVNYFTKTTVSNLFKMAGGLRIVHVDEKIEAFLQLDSRVKPNKIQNDYESCWEFLQKLENSRPGNFSWQRIKNALMNFLKRIGLYRYLKSAYSKISNFL